MAKSDESVGTLSRYGRGAVLLGAIGLAGAAYATGAVLMGMVRSFPLAMTVAYLVLQLGACAFLAWWILMPSASVITNRDIRVDTWRSVLQQAAMTAAWLVSVNALWLSRPEAGSRYDYPTSLVRWSIYSVALLIVAGRLVAARRREAASASRPS